MKISKYISSTLIVMVLGLYLLPFVGFNRYTILSGSMEPTLNVGDTVLVNTHDKDVNGGEVIAFHMGDPVVVHRVKEVSDEGIITQGDNNPSQDPGELSRDNVIGKVVSTNRVFVRLSTVLYSKWAFIVIVACCALSMLLEGKSVDRKEM